MREARLPSVLAFLIIAALIVGFVLGVVAGARVERAAAEQLSSMRVVAEQNR